MTTPGSHRRRNAAIILISIALVAGVLVYAVVIPYYNIPQNVSVRGIPSEVAIIGGPNSLPCSGQKCPIGGPGAECNGAPCPNDEIQLFLTAPCFSSLGFSCTETPLSGQIPFSYAVGLPNGYDYSTQVTLVNSNGSYIGTCIGSSINLIPQVSSRSLAVNIYCSS